jgi:hypothetical protein
MQAQDIVNKLLEAEPATTTLLELGITVQDEAELLWQFITMRDLKKPLTVRTIGPDELREVQVDDEGLMDRFNNVASRRQCELVARYRAELEAGSMSDMERTLIFGQGMLLDGNHRAVAAILAGKPMLYVNIDDLP